MKKIFLIILFLFVSCSQNEFRITKSNLIVENENDTLKLNIYYKTEGYKTDEFKGLIVSKISFKIDIKKPNGEIDTTVQSGTVDQIARKNVHDTPINTKYILPENSIDGNYTLIIKIKDEFSGKKIKTENTFNLKKEQITHQLPSTFHQSYKF